MWNHNSIPGKDKRFLSSQKVQTSSEDNTLSYSVGTDSNLHWVKSPGRESDR
jgi:hypothetical protein